MDSRRTTERGFTLIEVLIVVSVIGLVVTALSAAFVVIVRTNPANQERADDSRALLSLTRWLPDDVSSTYTHPYDITPSQPYLNGFDTDGGDPQCRADDSPAAVSLLNLRWSESATTYFVDYFWVRDGSTVDGLAQGKIVRYSCFGDSSGPTSSVESLSVSTPLTELPVAPTVPVTVTPICPEPLQDPDQLPSWWWPEKLTTDPSYDPTYDACTVPNSITGGVALAVSVWDAPDARIRDILEMVAVSKNVEGPPVGSSTGTGTGLFPDYNEPPLAGELTVWLHPGTSEQYDLPVFDYDGTLDRLVITEDLSLIADPTGWVVAPSVNSVDPFVDVTVPAGAPFATYEISLAVEDRDGGAGSEAADPPGKLTVNVVDPATNPTLDPPVVVLPDPVPPPCLTEFDSPAATPNPVELKRANNNPNNDVNVLDENVDVSITRTGACDPLVVRFVPDPENPDADNPDEFTEEFLNSLDLTIPKNAYVWRVGPRILELWEVKDGDDVLHDTLTLTVERAS